MKNKKKDEGIDIRQIWASLAIGVIATFFILLWAAIQLAPLMR